MTSNRPSVSLVLVLGISLFSASGCAENTSRVGNPELRELLFDSIMTLTANREAFSPMKNLHWGVVPLDAMENYRQEVISADTEEKPVATNHVTAKPIAPDRASETPKVGIAEAYLTQSDSDFT